MYSRRGTYEKDGRRVTLVQTNHNLFETRRDWRNKTTEPWNHRPKVMNCTAEEAHQYMISFGYTKVEDK